MLSQFFIDSSQSKALILATLVSHRLAGFVSDCGPRPTAYIRSEFDKAIDYSNHFNQLQLQGKTLIQ